MAAESPFAGSAFAGVFEAPTTEPDSAIFATFDSGAAVIPMAGDTIGAQTVVFETHYAKAQPGRWRDVEG